MKLLLDTHLLLRAASDPDRIPESARSTIEAAGNEPHFSVVSLWEVVVKSALGRADFRVDAHLLRRGLLDAGYVELPVTASHVLEVGSLPDHHRDPFDRMLVAQARCEGLLLLTADDVVARYPGPVRLVTGPAGRT